MAKTSGSTKSIGAGGASATRTTAPVSGFISKEESDRRYLNDFLSNIDETIKKADEAAKKGMGYDEVRLSDMTVPEQLPYTNLYDEAVRRIIGRDYNVFNVRRVSANSNRYLTTQRAIDKSDIENAYKGSVQNLRDLEKKYLSKFTVVKNIEAKAKTPSEKKYWGKVKELFVETAAHNLSYMSGIIDDNRRAAKKYLKKDYPQVNSKRFTIKGHRDSEDYIYKNRNGKVEVKREKRLRTFL